MEHITCKHEKDIERIVSTNDEQSKDLNSKVSWTVFWSVLVLLVGIASSVINSNMGRISEVEKEDALFHAKVTEDVNTSKIAQAKIDVQYVEIQKQLAEINLKLAKLK